MEYSGAPRLFADRLGALMELGAPVFVWTHPQHF